jgi:hypothetical protein
MLYLDGNVDVYKMECNRMLKYDIILDTVTYLEREDEAV